MDNEKTIYIEREGQYHEIRLSPNNFSIDESELDKELCTMGRTIFEYGSLEAEANLMVGRLSSEKEKLSAILDSQIRAEFAKIGDKATEAKISHAIVLNENYQTIVQTLLQAEKSHATIKWAMVALRHKSECLRALSFRENASIKADRG